MEVASQVHENHEVVDSPSQKQNTSVENHELASGQLSEPVEPRIRDFVAHQEQTSVEKQTIDGSIQEQNASEKKHELASKHLIEPTSVDKHDLVCGSEPVESTNIGSQNSQIIDCSIQKQNTSEEKHELASVSLKQPLETTSSLAQNCQTIGSSDLEQSTSYEKCDTETKHESRERMDITCVASAEAGHISGNSFLKENALGVKAELDSKFVAVESIETSIQESLETTSSLAQNYQTIGRSNLEQSTSYEKYGTETKHESRERMDIACVASAEAGLISANSFLKENALGVKAELDSEFVAGESIETYIQESIKSCHSEPIGSSLLESDSVDNGLPCTESMSIGSAAQKCQTSESAALDQNPPNEKYKMGSEHVSNDPGNTNIQRLDAVDNCCITGNSISSEDLLEGKSEQDLKHVLGGPSETRTALDNAQTYLSTDSCHNEHCSEHFQGGQTETRIVGSDYIDAAHSIDVAHSINAAHSDLETMIIDSAAQNFKTIGCSILEQNASENKHETGSEHELIEPVEDMTRGSCMQAGSAILKMSTLDGNTELDSKLVHDGSATSHPHNTQSMEPCFEPVKGEEMETRIVGSASVDVGESGTPLMCVDDKTFGSTNKESTGTSSRKRKSSSSAIPGPARILRPRSNGLVKPPEPSGTSASVCVEQEEKQKREGKRKKRKRTKNASENEFSKTRKHLRYLLTRIRYQHNFIDAYSGEGWKGQSVEKIKPEKELQRASSEILKCKRRIRELFEQMDSSCAEGRFQESLFDSEGQISSEDIFCAKCGSTDLSADNDIILCDGICDRGFHQKCLEPPLLKEEIPPGDESWLCPGCDCKADCIELLNECQGTNLCIDDVWEKVFPEAANTEVGNVIDEIAGLPSDDSEDYEYNPDAAEVEEGVQSKGASSEDSENSQYSGNSDDSDDSDDSDFSSASDDLGVLPTEDQYLGLPSDDSEDDEYDPNAPDIEHTKEESSSSDFTSASEDFSVSSDANAPSGTDDNPMSTSADGSKPPSRQQRVKIPKNTKEYVNSELQSIIEPNNQDDPLPISGKRQRERLDYKKLHDEAYGNGPSDSSDDDEWSEADSSPKKKDDGVGEESSLSPRSNLPTTRRSITKGKRKRGSNDSGDTLKGRKCMKKENEGGNSSAETRDGPEPNLTGKKATASAHKTLGEAVTQKLYESFKENEYPSRSTKESLANELGLSFQQVDKWFGNARWSARHSSNSAGTRAKGVSPSKDQTTELVELGADVSQDNTTNVEQSNPVSPNTQREGAALDRDTPDKGLSSNREVVAATISADLDHNTPDKASSSDREIVIAIPANSLEFSQTHRRGGKVNQGTSRSNSRSQTRKKSVTRKNN